MPLWGQSRDKARDKLARARLKEQNAETEHLLTKKQQDAAEEAENRRKRSILSPVGLTDTLDPESPASKKTCHGQKAVISTIWKWSDDTKRIARRSSLWFRLFPRQATWFTCSWYSRARQPTVAHLRCSSNATRACSKRVVNLQRKSLGDKGTIRRAGCWLLKQLDVTSKSGTARRTESLLRCSSCFSIHLLSWYSPIPTDSTCSRRVLCVMEGFLLRIYRPFYRIFVKQH
jgi:hypothetical protein